MGDSGSALMSIAEEARSGGANPPYIPNGPRTAMAEPVRRGGPVEGGARPVIGGEAIVDKLADDAFGDVLADEITVNWANGPAAAPPDGFFVLLGSDADSSPSPAMNLVTPLSIQLPNVAKLGLVIFLAIHDPVLSSWGVPDKRSDKSLSCSKNVVV